MRMGSGGAAITVAAAILGFALASAEGWQGQTAQKPPAKPAAKSKLTPAEEKARENYRKVCEPCHGQEGTGAPLPNMTKLSEGNWKHGTSLNQVAKVIAEGVPGTVMLPNKDKFTKEEILELAKLARSFHPKLKTAK